MTKPSTTSSTSRPFEVTSKRRKPFPSETRVKRGVRIVHGDVELQEKLGRNDLCVCGPDADFKKCCMPSGRFDGSDRDDYFQGVRLLALRSARGTPLL